jgi:protein-S-isoprenylcysteine O-methyltransferase Ste14
MAESLLIIAVFLAWSVLHSLTAAFRVKDWFQKAFGDAAVRLYRLGYVFFSLLTFIPVIAVPLLLPDVAWWTIPMPWALLTGLIQLASLLALSLSILQSGALAFVGIPQALGSADPATSETLNTGGLYRYMRHPLYTFSIIVVWLMPAMTRNLFTLFAAFTVYFIVGAVLEERKLLIQFGTAYRDYKKRTRMFIPFIV